MLRAAAMVSFACKNYVDLYFCFVVNIATPQAELKVVIELFTNE